MPAFSFLATFYDPVVPLQKCAICYKQFTTSGYRLHLTRFTRRCPKWLERSIGRQKRSVAKIGRRKREADGGPGWTRAQWLALLDHYSHTCVCCGFIGKLVPDHVTPLFRGGAHNILNIQPLCYKCNFRKGLQIIDYR